MLTFAILAISFFGVILDARPFAKLQWAHVYLFDWVAVVWLLFNFSKIGRNRLIEFAKTNRWIAFYFLYGLFLLAVDLFSPAFGGTAFSRIAQHAIIFVYPFVWTFIGYETLKIDSAIADKVMAAILTSFIVSHILIIFFHGTWEFSLGFVLLVFVLYFFSRKKRGDWLRGMALALFLFIPFWQMWGVYLNRTGVLQLLVGVVVLPFILFKQSLKKSAVIAGALALTLLLGFVAMSEIKHFHDSGLAAGAQSDFYDSALHGEDVSPGDHTFHARFRRFVWKTTISDWLERPILGRGFIPEIPSYLEPTFKNQGGYFFVKDAPPVSGAHNSYLTILARMGPIGLGFFVLAMWVWFKKMIVRKKNFLEACVFVIPLFGFFYALFNIGIEAPQSSVVLWFCYGVGMAL